VCVEQTSNLFNLLNKKSFRSPDEIVDSDCLTTKQKFIKMETIESIVDQIV